MAVRQIHMAWVLCKAPEPGMPRPPNIETAPVGFSIQFCKTLADHIQPAITVSYEALVLYEEVRFWHSTEQRITAAEIATWYTTLELINRQLRAQARASRELVQASIVVLQDDIQIFSYRM